MSSERMERDGCAQRTSSRGCERPHAPHDEALQPDEARCVGERQDGDLPPKLSRCVSTTEGSPHHGKSGEDALESLKQRNHRVALAPICFAVIAPREVRRRQRVLRVGKS